MLNKKPFLFDSSVWINYFRNINTQSSDLLFELLDESENFIILCPIIVQEVLQGLRYEEQFTRVDKILSSLYHLPCGHYEASNGAAKIFFDLKKKGVTIRKPNDCLIAWYALEYNLPLAHDDKDFELISQSTRLITFN